MFTRASNDILFVEGVNLDKIIKMSTTTTTTTQNENDFAEEKIYDDFKNKFSGLEAWDYTDIHCLHCSLGFDTKPVFIPKKINSDTNIEVLGNFCSFPCCLSYINIYYSNNDIIRCNYINNLKYLYFLFYDRKIMFIPEAPDKIEMKKYGGHMSEKEYKEEIKQLSNQIK